MPYNEQLEGKSLNDQLPLALNGLGKKKKKVIAKIMGWDDFF